MLSCSICGGGYPIEEITEIGLGSRIFQCEECWNNYGEEI
jgi:hypothetical protein